MHILYSMFKEITQIHKVTIDYLSKQAHFLI
jgi:hypothetical protein